MFNFLKKLLGKTYTPLNTIYIYKNNLLQNYQYLSALQRGVSVSPVLKSNAYGHGLVEIAKILDSKNAPFFCVDSLYEAYELLKVKIKTPILIMGYVVPENLKVKSLPFSYAVYDITQLELIARYQKTPKIHVKIDTGMHRLGIQLSELEEFITQLKKYPNVTVEGIMSHLAEPTDTKFTKVQLDNFKKACLLFKKEGIIPKWRHIGATGGILHANLTNISNMVRVGKALYGVHKDINLAPVLQFETTLVSVKNIKKEEPVGYDKTFTSQKDMIIGVLAAGYHDGVDRRLSDKGSVTIENKKCPIIGRVSMNLTTIDLTSVKNPKIGQKATVYSTNPNDSNSVENAADLCETIPYEILVHLPQGTRRVVV